MNQCLSIIRLLVFLALLQPALSSIPILAKYGLCPNNPYGDSTGTFTSSTTYRTNIAVGPFWTPFDSTTIYNINVLSWISSHYSIFSVTHTLTVSTPGLTVCSWIYLSNDDITILHMAHTSIMSYDFHVARNSYTNSLSLVAYNSGISSETTFPHASLYNWHHYCLVVQGPSTLLVYEDSVLVLTKEIAVISYPMVLNRFEVGYASSSKTADVSFFPLALNSTEIHIKYTEPNSCFYCSAGQIISSGTTCLACSPGTYTPNGALSQCIQCSLGTYASETGMHQCLNIPNGTISTDRINLVNCSAGKYSIPPNSVCLTCPEGSYSSLPATYPCLLCPQHTYSASNRTLCIPCPSTLFTFLPGSPACISCPNGTYQHWGSGRPPTGTTSCQACKTCPSNTYHSSICNGSTLSDNSTCTQFSSCDYYSAPILPLPTGSPSQVGTDLTCRTCFCRKDQYFTGPCSSLASPPCAYCKLCFYGYTQTCTSTSDSVCQPYGSCSTSGVLDNTPQWLEDRPYIKCPRGTYISNMTGTTPICKQCPNDLISLTGKYCIPCTGYRMAYWDHSECICRMPALQDDLGRCVCGKGHGLDISGCSPCPNNTYSSTSVILNEDWFTQSKPCTECNMGTYSLAGSSKCIACPPYSYRVSLSTPCLYCPAGYYTTNPRSSSCSSCVSSCSLGQYSTPCPTPLGNKTLFCSDCSSKPSHSTWLPNSIYSTSYECVWQCNTGYYRNNGLCSKCSTSSSIQCLPGKLIIPCSDIQDTSCDTDCFNETKPEFNSEWGIGCDWKCVTGYRLQVVPYGMWTLYECVQDDSLPFWDW